MATRESQLWKWLKQAETRITDRTLLHWSRIENAAASGTLDVEGCFRGGSFDIELKVAAKPKRANTPIRIKNLRLSQIAYLENRWAAGGNAWVLVQVGRKRYLIPGCHARLLIEPYAEVALRTSSFIDPAASPVETLTVAADESINPIRRQCLLSFSR